MLLDRVMCIMWVATYVLCLVGTIKYKYPSISPIFQIINAPFEISVIVLFVKNGGGITFVFVIYCIWCILEIAILITGAVKGCYKKKYIPFYTAGFLVMTALMIYLTVFKGFMFQLTYINAFIGEIFWFALVYKKDYPAKPINLAAFVAKFIADVAAVPVYISSGAWYMHVVCVLLPIFDFCFLVLYFKKKKKARNKLTKL